MASMDESWAMRNGLMIPNRSVLAAMTNKQSHADGTLSDEEIAFLTRRAERWFWHHHNSSIARPRIGTRMGR